MLKTEIKLFPFLLSVIVLISLNVGSTYGYVYSISAPCVNTFSSDTENSTTEEVTESTTQINTNKKSPDTGNHTFKLMSGLGIFISLSLFLGLDHKKYRRKE